LDEVVALAPEALAAALETLLVMVLMSILQSALV